MKTQNIIDEYWWQLEKDWSLEKNVKIAVKNYRKKFKEEPTHIALHEKVVEYDGNLEVEFRTNIQKNVISLYRSE